MQTRPLTDPVIRLLDGPSSLRPSPRHAPNTIPDPDTGQPLQVAAVDVSDLSVCPSCAALGAGGYVSFVSDLRLAFACKHCQQVVWLAGA